MQLKLVAAAAALTCTLSHLSLRAESNLPGELTDQYAPAVEKLQAFYLHATVTGALDHQLPQQHKHVKQHFTYRAAGSHMRLDATAVFVAEHETDRRLGSTDIWLATPDASLIAFRAPNAEAAFDTANYETYRQAGNAIETVCPLHFVYALDLHGTLFDRLQRAEVTNVRSEKSTGQHAGWVKVSFDETASHDGKHGTWKSTVLLSPSEGWALRHYTRTLGHDGQEARFDVNVSYAGSKDGTPLVKRIEWTRHAGGKRDYVERREVVVDNFLPGAASQYYFTAFSL